MRTERKAERRRWRTLAEQQQMHPVYDTAPLPRKTKADISGIGAADATRAYGYHAITEYNTLGARRALAAVRHLSTLVFLSCTRHNLSEFITIEEGVIAQGLRRLSCVVGTKCEKSTAGQRVACSCPKLSRLTPKFLQRSQIGPWARAGNVSF